MTLLTNDNFEDELTKLAKDAVEVRALIAFLAESGLAWLPKDKYSYSHFIVGVDLDITAPGSLQALDAGGADLRVFHDPQNLFLPKAIYVKTSDSEYLIIGSNNLTSPGISSSYEVSTLSERDENNEGVFSDFLNYFDSLLFHEYCYPPDDKLYKDYITAEPKKNVSAQLGSETRTPLARPPMVKSEPQQLAIESGNLSTLSEFIQLLATEFPTLDRSKGVKIVNHPLKRMNDDEFRPLFEEIVSTASQGNLEGSTSLNVGGKWFKNPNIFVCDRDKEPWDNVHITHGIGRLATQIHFSEDFSTVFFSVVLQYNVHTSIKTGEMPARVEQRFTKIMQHLENHTSEAQRDGPSFWQWQYKTQDLWSKPLLTFEHEIDALPSDETLHQELVSLIDLLDDAASIR